jgi:hypothetical protein
MTETERLRAVAKYYRRAGVYEGFEPDAQCLALADLFDGIAERHTPYTFQVGDAPPSPMWVCGWCEDQGWPCPDVRAALAVADALGIGEQT